MSEKNTYAIIKTGGKQYRVAQDDVIDVELLEGEDGSIIEFADILFVSNGSDTYVGSPTLLDFSVTAELLGESKGEKITSIKYIPGNHYKKFGHRQKYSRIKITGISLKEQSSRQRGEQHGT